MMVGQSAIEASPPASTARRHPALVPAMSSLLIVLVFLGFAPTYYLRPVTLGSIPAFLHIHGAAMTAWFLLLLTQTLLIATRRPAVHRRLGVAGALLAVVIVVLNPLVIAWSVPKLLTSGPIELTALIVVGDLLVMATFLVLAGLAIRWRRYPQTHSRMLLLASVAVSGPALGRLSLNLLGTPFPGVITLISLPLLVVVHDRVLMKRVHPATKWGAIAIAGSIAISVVVANTSAGGAIVRWFL